MTTFDRERTCQHCGKTFYLIREDEDDRFCTVMCRDNERYRIQRKRRRSRKGNTLWHKLTRDQVVKLEAIKKGSDGNISR
jgi:hypothetical protein